LFRWADICHDLEENGIEINGIDAVNLQEDQDNLWRRLAKRMPVDKKTGKWTANKVEYAWHHGVSSRSHFTLDPVQWTEKLSYEVDQIKKGVHRKRV
jgi:hypothetical protein